MAAGRAVRRDRRWRGHGRASRGRPSVRSAMMLRWISSRPAVDRVGAGEQEQPLPVVQAVGPLDQRRAPRDLHGQLARGRGASAPTAAWPPTPRSRAPPGRSTAASVRSACARITSRPTPGAGQPVADAPGRSAAPVAAGEFDERVELAAEPDLLAERGDAALEAERCPSRPVQPSPGSPTHQSASVRASSKNTSLNSRGAGELA